MQVTSWMVYVGGESDAWVLDAVRETKNKEMIKVNMMELISDRTKEEEVIEGMQESRFQFRHTHTHSHSADDHSDDHADEHSDDHTADDHTDEYTAGDHSGDHSEDNHADDHSLEAGHSHADEDRRGYIPCRCTADDHHETSVRCEIPQCDNREDK